MTDNQTGTAKKIRTLVVDDAAFMRRALVEILTDHDDIEVVGVARHGREALEAVESLDPDVITLDVDMPVMDGLTTIKHLMVRKPRPVIMVSGMADQGRVTFEALKLGAVDFFEKPSGTVSLDMKDSAQELSQVVRVAAGLNPSAIRRVRPLKRKNDENKRSVPASKLLAVFALDGACGTFIRMMSYLDSNLPLAVAAVQNVSRGVLTSYATEFNGSTSWHIHACQGGRLDEGSCFIAGYGETWRIEQADHGNVLEIETEGHDPRAFLEQAADLFGADCMAVVLGGSFNPAPEGFERVRQRGGRVVVLAPDASVNGGAARELLAQGGCEQALSERDLRMLINSFARADNPASRAA